MYFVAIATSCNNNINADDGDFIIVMWLKDMLIVRVPPRQGKQWDGRFGNAVMKDFPVSDMLCLASLFLRSSRLTGLAFFDNYNKT